MIRHLLVVAVVLTFISTTFSVPVLSIKLYQGDQYFPDFKGFPGWNNEWNKDLTTLFCRSKWGPHKITTIVHQEQKYRFYGPNTLHYYYQQAAKIGCHYFYMYDCFDLTQLEEKVRCVIQSTVMSIGIPILTRKPKQFGKSDHVCDDCTSDGLQYSYAFNKEKDIIKKAASGLATNFLTMSETIKDVEKTLHDIAKFIFKGAWETSVAKKFENGQLECFTDQGMAVAKEFFDVISEIYLLGWHKKFGSGK